eukprot:3545030-Ditylum_brightwellii.AAC.1
MGSVVDPTPPHSKNRIWRLDGKDSGTKYDSPVSWSVSMQAARVKPSCRAWTDSDHASGGNVHHAFPVDRAYGDVR